MTYLTVKAIHLVSVIFWIGGLFLATVITASGSVDREMMRKATRVTETEIGVSWVAGGILVVMGSWYTSSWWYVKIIFVVLISAIHSIVHRRWKAGGTIAQTNTFLPYAVFLLVFPVVILAVFKWPA